MKLKFLLFLFLYSSVQAKDLELKTTIKEVTVYQSGAQVKRTGSIHLLPGTHVLAIRDFSPTLRKESIQLSADGDFTILSVNHQVRKEEPVISKEKIAELDLKEKKLQQEVEEYAVAFDVLKSEEAILNNLKTISTSQQGVTVEQIVKAQETMKTRMIIVKNEQLRIRRILRDKNEDLQKVQQELQALRIEKNTIVNEIIVNVKVAKETDAIFKLAYIVPNARWYATYDLRVKTISDPLQIDYKAQISQQTGEDWNKVKLKLSTGDPSESQERPKVAPWSLYLNQPYVNPYVKTNYYKYTDASQNKVTGKVFDENTGEPLPFCNIIVNGQNIGTTTDFEGQFSLVLPPDARELKIAYIGYETKIVPVSTNNMIIYLRESAQTLSEITVQDYNAPLIDKDGSGAYTIDAKSTRGDRTANRTTGGVTQSGNNASFVPVKTEIAYTVVTEFEIDETTTIISDPKETTVLIKTIQSAAHYQYYCAPRLDKDAFLTAQLTNWEDLNLMQGNASIFFEGSYIGKTLLDTRFISDTLDISLGRDKNIVVERTKAKEYNRKQVLGNDQIAYRDWDIKIRNGKKQKISMILEDQYPLASDSRIEVKRDEHSNGKLDETTGIIVWKLEIAPGETKNLKLKYSVKYPKGFMIGLD
jgi:hypothetical protein